MSTQSVILFALNNQKFTTEDEKILHYLNNQLATLNLKILKTEILLNVDTLAARIKEWLTNCDAILITGKKVLIFDALSKCLNEKLIISKYLGGVYKNGDILVPRSAKIYQIQDHANGIDPVCINIRNIFIFPDDLHSVEVLCERFISQFLNINTHKNYGKHYVLHCNGNDLACLPNNNYVGDVSVTKYCTAEDDRCEWNVIFKSDNFAALTRYENDFKDMISSRFIRSEIICDNFWYGLDFFKSEEFVQQAISVIKDCYSDYDPQDVFLCFNGGKDCTVLLYLTLYVLKAIHPNYKKPLKCLYVQSKNPFVEVEEFIHSCVVFYNLELITINDSIKVALREVLIQQPNLKACLMGTRRTDPFAKHLNNFQVTDPEWPQVMRVSPILDWEYKNIWDVLLTCKIPYCELYDLGYTSLGSRTNTGPNPSLKCSTDKHMPAFKLLDGSKERDGRR